MFVRDRVCVGFFSQIVRCVGLLLVFVRFFKALIAWSDTSNVADISALFSVGCKYGFVDRNLSRNTHSNHERLIVNVQLVPDLSLLGIKNCILLCDGVLF